MPKQISSTQELYLQLIALSSFNGFDGERTAADLRANLGAWEGVIMVDEHNAGITLRDLPREFNNVGTLFATTEDPDSFREMADAWNPDEIDWYTGKARNPPEQALHLANDRLTLFRLWWD